MLTQIKHRFIAKMAAIAQAAVDQRSQRDQSVIEQRLSALEASIDDRVAKAIGEASIDDRVARAIGQRLFKPRLPAMNNNNIGPFMAYSNCSTADMLHPRYAEICALLYSPLVLHRKMWEWAFVIHHLQQAGVLSEGHRGICFGVGQEPLPAFFAGLGAWVMATDAPPDIGTAGGWAGTGQHVSSREPLRAPHLCPDEQFDRLVHYRDCDMTAIDPDQTGYDFTWSSCCLEHLGSLEAGMQFFINSVETCLKPGGIAVHTTELNMTSDSETLEFGPTVLYRRRDIAELIERLRSRGHDPQPFTLAPDAHVLDFHVDVPPYLHDPHVKLAIGSHVCTSVGLVVRRG